MSVWSYADNSRATRSTLETFISQRKCIYCGTSLTTIHYQPFPSRFGDAPNQFHQDQINVCNGCGWWNIKQDVRAQDEYSGGIALFGAAGTLRELNLTDLMTPIAEIRGYLLAKYAKRYELHPRLFEQTVASVFDDLGYSTQVTGYSHDGGIDVILEKGGATIGIQVKRHRNSIQVEQIRAFAGALMLKGLTEGIFVTTSRFQSGAESTINRYKDVGYKIRLIDAPRFYDALRITRRNRIQTKDDFEAQFGKIELRTIRHWLHGDWEWEP